MTPPSLAFLEDQLVKAKAMGFNCLRCHIKVPDPRYYDAADRLGMLIWTDAPNFERFTPQAASRLRDTLAGMVERDFNHPCIIAWTIINEDWGTQLERDATQRKWLAQTYDWLKALDPTRLVVDNSPCWPNFHVKSDLDDFHWLLQPSPIIATNGTRSPMISAGAPSGASASTATRSVAATSRSLSPNSAIGAYRISAASRSGEPSLGGSRRDMSAMTAPRSPIPMASNVVSRPIISTASSVPTRSSRRRRSAISSRR